MAEPLTEHQIQQALGELPGWRWTHNRLEKRFEFEDFREAISFIIRLAFSAERIDHHPELRNVYNRVDIAVTTHDAGNRVTDKDLELAREIESFAWT